MPRLLGKTTSLCPVCLNIIPASKILECRKVYLDKTCPEHGQYRVLIWHDGDHYDEWGKNEAADFGLLQTVKAAAQNGCPYDCGLCPQHEQDTCTAVIEVTAKCDLYCPICFADSSECAGPPVPSEDIRRVFERLLGVTGQIPIQLSGGEPTLRDDLAGIIAMGSKMGFPHIQVNTNGIRISREKDYLARLKDAGLSVIFLQMDGVDNEVFRRIRGTDLLDIKLQAIGHCEELHVGVILVPTLIPDINTHQIGDIIRFAKSRIPTVKGVHFQPVSYFGRHPGRPKDEDRITIPLLLDYIEIQSAGELKRNDFLSCEPRYCSFSGSFILGENGRLLSTAASRRIEEPSSCCNTSPAERARKYIDLRWRYTEQQTDNGCECLDSWLTFHERAKSRYLSITGMAFQDIWNIDIDRLKRCCIHVATFDGRLVPLCAYYLTGEKGKRIFDG